MTTKRILVLGPPQSGKFTLLKELSGSLPSTAPTDLDIRQSHAGLSHTLPLKNKYFENEIPVWIDEYEVEREHAGINTWAKSFSSEDAQEVVSALGAIIYTFRKPESKESAKALNDRIQTEIETIHKTLIDYSKKGITNTKKDQEEENEVDDDDGDLIDWGGICLAVAVPTTKSISDEPFDLDYNEYDTMLQPFGFEFIDMEKSGRNDYGELLGLERIKEALGAFSWDTVDDSAQRNRILSGYQQFDSDLEQQDYEEDLDSEGFDQELREMQLEMAALHFAMDADKENDGANEEPSSANPLPEKDVEELENIMQRMKAVREQGEGLPFEERKKLADQLVGDLMRLL
ncbi:hypothetical protein V1512DRAFT_102243 [Lipomyces arxii]|uniref:uncharacterized protein n=1 Tax=Lipomyces arxii TaxID=56418 RepID=UPI0034CF1FA3